MLSQRTLPRCLATAAVGGRIRSSAKLWNPVRWRSTTVAADGGSVLSPALSALRDRQRLVLQSLERTLVDIGADEEHSAVLRDALSTSVFLICTVGEFNAGKSSLLNALLSGPFCRVGVLPTTDAITVLRHPSAIGGDGGGSRGNSVVTVDVPTPWLRDVSVVDTPGTNTLDATHTALTTDFLPRADLLLFVTSAERPFSESERTFLRAIRSWGKKVLFVVNKADLLPSPGDLDAVVGYVAQHGAKELGEPVPVLPVSAGAARRLKEQRDGGQAAPAAADPTGLISVDLGRPLAAHAQSDAERLSAVQWEALEGRILRVIGSDARAAAKLQSQLSLARAVLATYEGRQRREAALVSADVALVADARRRIDAFAEETAAEFEAQRARVRVVLHGLQQRGHDFLDDELQISMLPRLLRRDDFVQRFQRAVLAGTADELQATVASVAAWMDHKGTAQARATAELLATRLQQPSSSQGDASSTAGAVAGAVAGVGGFASQRLVLLEELQTSARTTMRTLDPESAAARMVTTAQASLAQAALLTSGAAGLSGLVAVKAAALADLTGLLPAALLAGVGLGVLPWQRHRLQREFREKIEVLAATLDRAVGAHLTRELDGAKHQAVDIVMPLSTLVASASEEHERRLKALESSRTALDELGQSLSAIERGGE